MGVWGWSIKGIVVMVYASKAGADRGAACAHQERPCTYERESPFSL